jgi:polar amino acid transport system permease protein
MKRRALGWVILAILGALVCYILWVVLTFDYKWSNIWPHRFAYLKGMAVTIAISTGSLMLSTVIGALLTAAQLSGLRATRVLARTYVELIRGTPLLVQLLIGYYIVSDAFGIDSRFTAGIVLLSAFAGAYLSEIFRGGIESIPGSQMASARAVGFTTAQMYRYVIVPQAVRQVLPAVAGQFANLIKDSSLLSVIAVTEFTRAAQGVDAATLAGIASYMPLAAGYLVLTLPISFWTRRLESRLQYAH